MNLPDSVVVREVGPRDGLQNWGGSVSTEDKLRLLAALGRTGIQRIEAAAFVAPSVVPLMADAETVFARLDRTPGVRYEALVPNKRGAERAVQAGADRLVFVLAASESFNLRNVRMSVAQSVEMLAEVKAYADEHGAPVTLVIATSFDCPYDGAVPLAKALALVETGSRLGIDEVTLADTIGTANPAQVHEATRAATSGWPQLRVGLHLHDTRGMGLANLVAGIQSGARIFDASVGGIGGCPFAVSARGNVATEDVVHMLHQMGIQTGIDQGRLMQAATLAEKILGGDLSSCALSLERRRLTTA